MSHFKVYRLKYTTHVAPLWNLTRYGHHLSYFEKEFASSNLSLFVYVPPFVLS